MTTLKDLIAAAVRKTQDVGRSKLWSREDWIDYANQAEVDACRRARLIIDSVTPEICTIKLKTGTSVYDVDPRVIYVRRVDLSSNPTPLTKIRMADLDARCPGWKTLTGSVDWFCRDYAEGKLLFVRKPEAVDTANLTVYRLPLRPMCNDDDAPEIPYDEGLVNGMLSRAYLKDDEQTLDPKKAERFEALFTREFGPPVSSMDERWIERHHNFDESDGQF